VIPVLPVSDLPLPGRPTGPRLSVVLVDDDEDFRGVVQRCFERTDELAIVGEAVDGATGVEVAAALHPDVVLLDIDLLALGGLETLPALAQRCPGTIVVMLTAMSPSAQLDAALRAGAAGIIRKGSSMANMVAQLRGLVGLAQIPEIEIEGVG
jgi:two-component system nitrate/nitrite response regulator NarL